MDRCWHYEIVLVTWDKTSYKQEYPTGCVMLQEMVKTKLMVRKMCGSMYGVLTN